MDTSDQVTTKIENIAEQLRLALREYPYGFALDRIYFALSLTHFASAQLKFDEDATIPPITLPTTADIGPLV